MGSEAADLASAYAYCEMLVRRDDPDRWLSSLFMPAALRPHCHALYAFSLEIARVREITSEPLLGEIRFQWWREALEGLRTEELEANPVGMALVDTIRRFSLPTEPLVGLIEAREFDLYDEPMASVAGLEAYCRATSASPIELIVRILDPAAPAAHVAAEHGGIAYALTGLLRALPWHLARGQLYVPLELLVRHKVGRVELLAGQISPAVHAVLADLRALARSHLSTLNELRADGLGLAEPAFLPVSLCEAYLRRMEKHDYDPFKTMIALPQWRRQWILWRAAK
jgi:phytoene synthase